MVITKETKTRTSLPHIKNVGDKKFAASVNSSLGQYAKTYSYLRYGSREKALLAAHRELSAWLRERGGNPLPPLSIYEEQFGLKIPDAEGVGDDALKGEVDEAPPIRRIGAPKGKAGIRWTHPERVEIAKRVAHLRLEHFEMSVIDLIKLAQKEVLPPDRYREIRTQNNIGQELLELIKAALKSINEKVQAPSPAEQPAPAPAAAPAEATEPIVLSVEVENKDPMRAVRVLSNGTLVGILFDRIYEDLKTTGFSSKGLLDVLSKVATSGSSGIVAKPQPPSPIVVEPAAPPREKKARVLVVGLLPGQVQEVAEKIRGLAVQVSYYDASHAGLEIPPSAEYIILAKFVSHKWWDKSKANLPNDRIFFVQGTTGVIQKLYDIHSRQKSGV